MATDQLTPEQLISLDSAAIEAYNRRASAKFQLHPEIGPSPFEGDISNASVVLLLANPGFDSLSSPEDHRFTKDGWPLAGLHPEAPPGLRKWWSMRLRHLIEEFGAENVSKSVACLQLTPWASEKFDDSLRLPSRVALLEAAELCARRGAVLIVMRAERLWLESPTLRSAKNRFRVNSWRSSFVSPGNLSGEAWPLLLHAIHDKSRARL